MSGDPEPAVDLLGLGRERREVAARLRLAEQLAPELLRREDRGEPPFLLLGRAVGEESGCHQVDRDASDQLRRSGPCHLLGDQEVLGRSEAPAAELGRPGHPHPAVGGQLGLPLAAERRPPRRDPESVEVVRCRTPRAGWRPANRAAPRGGVAARASSADPLRSAWHRPAATSVWRSARRRARLVSFVAMEFELSADQRALAEAAADLLEGMASSERVRVTRRARVRRDGRRRDRPSPSRSTASSGRRWPSRAGSGSSCRRTRAVSDSAWSRWRSSASSSGDGWHRPPSSRPFSASVRCTRRAATTRSLREVRRRAGHFIGTLSEGRSVGCVAWADALGSPRDPRVADGCSSDVQSRPSTRPWRTSRWSPPTRRSTRRSSARGSARRTEPSMDRTRPLGWLALRRDAGLADRRSRTPRPACSTVRPPRPRPSCSARPQRALEMSVEYAKVRRQFGHPIGSFQAVKHRLADALVDVEAMRSSAYYAAWCLGHGRPGGLAGGLDGQGVVLGRLAAGHGRRRCRCTVASASPGSTTSTSTSSEPSSTRAASAVPRSIVTASPECSPPTSRPGASPI